MKFLSVVTPTPAIYHGCSIWKIFREDNFTPVNMKSCGRRNARKHREIKNGEKYIILDISSRLIVWTRGKSPLHNQRVLRE